MHAERIAAVRKLLRDEDLDAFLFSDATDIRWCCGFTGSSGILLVDRAGAILLTDGRYRDQAREEVSVATVEIYRDSIVKYLSSLDVFSDGHSVGLDSATTTVDLASRFEEEFPDLDLATLSSPLKHLRSRKDQAEIATMRRAQAITDEVFSELLGLIRPGMLEREVAAEIVYRHMMKGAQHMAFEPIVASGPNGALPHARPSDRAISVGDLVVLDFGCFVDGYASDMTRTISVGTPSDDARKVYEIVLSAQSKAQEQAKSGMAASALDGIARNLINEAGFGEAFSHSLGHGLGLNVHEWPRIAASSRDQLPDGAVVTIEPGIYLHGRFGVRIENAVILREDGAEPLPKSDTALIVV